MHACLRSGRADLQEQLHKHALHHVEAVRQEQSRGAAAFVQPDASSLPSVPLQGTPSPNQNVTHTLAAEAHKPSKHTVQHTSATEVLLPSKYPGIQHKQFILRSSTGRHLYHNSKIHTPSAVASALDKQPSSEHKQLILKSSTANILTTTHRLTYLLLWLLRQASSPAAHATHADHLGSWRQKTAAAAARVLPAVEPHRDAQLHTSSQGARRLRATSWDRMFQSARRWE
eukprot:1158508-Pelagomonas_calceolata.AAC.20